MPIDHARLARHPMVRWSVIGGLFSVLGLGLLHVFFAIFHWPYWFATALQAELCTVLRFLVNDRWVFGERRPTWTRFVHYHIANAGSFAVWWGIANLLQWQGVHHLVAAILAAACSFGVSLVSNFFWVWRKRAVAR